MADNATNFNFELNASNPSPLLVDKLAALPEGSKKRAFYENFLNTLNNKTANVGTGFDSISRESHKSVHQILRSSNFLQEGIKEDAPDANNLIGQEEGTVVSNLQSWKPFISSAAKPISDAMGSHADISHSVIKNPIGSEQFLPTSLAAQVDRIAPQITNELDSSFKSVQADNITHLPSKMTGSVRNLSTAGDKKLSVPFEISPDSFNGLMNVMDNISNVVDKLMTTITNYSFSAIGGLTNAMFPPDQLTKLLNSLGKLSQNIGDMSQMLGGFTAVTDITNQLQSSVQSFSSGLKDPTALAKSYLPNVTNNLGSLTSKLPSGVLPGGLNNLGGGLGNLGSVIGGAQSNIGQLLPQIRDPKQLLSGVLPPELSKQLENINKIPGLGLVGNMGFSVGNIMDPLKDVASSTGLSKLATHAPILGPLFNKQTGDTEETQFAGENNTSMFVDSKFVPGAQGNKGVTMLGPLGTTFQKAFPSSFASVSTGKAGQTPSSDTFPTSLNIA